MLPYCTPPLITACIRLQRLMRGDVYCQSFRKDAWLTMVIAVLGLPLIHSICLLLFVAFTDWKTADASPAPSSIHFRPVRSLLISPIIFSPSLPLSRSLSAGFFILLHNYTVTHLSSGADRCAEMRRRTPLAKAFRWTEEVNNQLTAVHRLLWVLTGGRGRCVGANRRVNGLPLLLNAVKTGGQNLFLYNNPSKVDMTKEAKT